MPYVISSLANNQVFADYVKGPDEGKGRARPAVIKKQVFINGGAGVRGSLSTPQGVITNVSQEDADFLAENKSFQRMVSRGFMKIVSRQVDPDKAAEKDLSDGDASAQLSVESGDFEEGGRASGPAPTVQTQA